MAEDGFFLLLGLFVFCTGPRTTSVNRADLKLRDVPAPASLVLDSVWHRVQQALITEERESFLKLTMQLT